MTDYTILKEKDKEAGHWLVVGSSKERSAKAAIRALIVEDNSQGTFIAIPSRSWQPVKVALETALKFS